MSKNLMGLDFKVDENAISEVVKTVVQSSIVEALGQKEKLVEQAVRTMLTTQVDNTGKVSSYRSDNKHTLINWHVENSVHQLCKELMSEILEDNREALKKELKKQLSSNRSVESFARSLIDGTIENLDNRWSPSMKITFSEKEDY